MHKTKDAFWVTCNALLAALTTTWLLNICTSSFDYKTTILTTFLSNTTYVNIVMPRLEQIRCLNARLALITNCANLISNFSD